MTPQPPSPAETLFLAAQEKLPEQRDAFLDTACAGAPELRAEVEALLVAAASGDEYFRDIGRRLRLSALLEPPMSDADGGAGSLRPGSSIGPYRLVREIGRGGSGVIWEAERDDGMYEGRVAVKLLKASAALQGRRRFEMEGRYLATLTHPNIAHLLDAGELPGGQRYLVIELVRGQAMDVYCDQRALGIEQRIELLIDVLSAVSHAHAQLIVHRDIKPSNVLVAQDGRVKLLDFGVAKLFYGDGEEDEGLTGEVGTALTPQFAAPEQLLGRRISTRTDVYALGLLAYLLLTGQHPRPPVAGQSYSELLASLQQEPPQLSRAVVDDTLPGNELIRKARQRDTTPAALCRLLRGDLDNVVAKALAFEPERRYGTVNDFAADLRRFLHHEPVTAQPATATYRLSKFVRRHRGGVLVASLTALALVISTAVTAWQMFEAQRQRDVAIYQQQRVQASKAFLQLLLGEIGPNGGPLTLRDLLDRGVAMLDHQFGADERFVARTLYEVSTLYATLGSTDVQRGLLDRAASVARAEGDDDLLATALCAQARLSVESDIEDARQLAREGGEALEQVALPYEDAIVECGRAGSMLSYADGDGPGAIALLEATLARLSAGVVFAPTDRVLLLNDLAEQHFNANHPVQALPVLEEIIELNEKIGQGGTVGHVIYLMNHAAILSRLGEVSSAAASQRVALARVKGLANPPVGLPGHYANSLLRLARYGEALALLREDLDSATRSGNTRWIAQIEMQIGRALLRAGRLSEAEEHLDRADAAYGVAPDGHDRQVTMLNLARAEVSLRGGRTEDAQRLVDAELTRLGYPARHSEVGLSSALWLAADVALALGDSAAAERFANDELELVLAMARNPAISADVGQALLQRGTARLALGDAAGGLTDLGDAVGALERGFSADHPDTAAARRALQSAGAQ